MWHPREFWHWYEFGQKARSQRLSRRRGSRGSPVARELSSPRRPRLGQCTARSSPPWVPLEHLLKAPTGERQQFSRAYTSDDFTTKARKFTPAWVLVKSLNVQY